MLRPVEILMSLSLLLSGCMGKKVRELEAQVSDRDATIQQISAENQGYVLEIDLLRSELTKMERKHAALAAVYDDMLAEFGPGFDNGTAELIVFQDRTILSLGEDIYFPSGSATLNADGKAEVARLAELLKAHPTHRFQVEGHTDPLPIATAKYPSNWELGAARAISVVKALIAEGVNENQLSASTYAYTSPVAFNDSDTGRAENRRINLTFQPGLDDSGAQAALYERASRVGHVRLIAKDELRTATRDE